MISANHCRFGSRAELRKEKSERAPGGVTPGDELYHAAAQRARVENPPAPSYSSNSDFSSQDMQALQRPVMQQPQRNVSITRSSRQPGMPGGVAGDQGLASCQCRAGLRIGADSKFCYHVVPAWHVQRAGASRKAGL